MDIELDYYCPFLCGKKPTCACPFALNSIKALQSDFFSLLFIRNKVIFTDEECDWYILDEKSHYCWWVFWNNIDNIREYTLEEISALLGICPASVMHIQNKAMDKLKNTYYLDNKYNLVETHSPEIQYNDCYLTSYTVYLLKTQFILSPSPKNLEDLIENKIICFSEQLELPFSSSY